MTCSLSGSSPPLIVRHRPVLIVEYDRQNWARFGGTLEQALELIRGWGYELFHIQGGMLFPLNTGGDDCDLIAVPTACPGIVPGRTT